LGTYWFRLLLIDAVRGTIDVCLASLT
jgi:hypothetical protein